MFKVIFRIKDKSTGKVTTNISQGYVDTRIAALSYASSVKQEYFRNGKSEVIDFYIIGVGGSK